MSLRCQSWVYENSEATGNERLILLAIADEADDDGTNAYPGVDRIARKARVNQRTTMRCIERLEEAGRLVVRRPETKGRGHHNTYVVVMEEARQKGDTLTPESGEKGDRNPRNTALPYLDGHRPSDPEIQTDQEPSFDVTFDHFWAIYPRNTAKAEARRAWTRAAKKVDPRRIVSAAAHYAIDPNLPEPQFIPHASTWLNGERWNDGPLPPRAGKARPRTADSAIAEDPSYWEEP